jgi:serine/threonine-protein kinase
MYELLEGHRPFEAESFSEMCVKVAVDPPAPMQNTPPALQQVVLRCLAKSPEQRYPTMADLGRDLVPFARDPHAAQMMVERMFRMLGRATPPIWEGPAVSTSTRAPIHSAPIRTATPMPSMQHDAMPTLKKKRSGMVIGIVAGLCIAAGGVALYATSRGEEPASTPTESKAAPTPNPPPPDNSATKVDVTPPKPDEAKTNVPAEDAKPNPPTDEVADVKPVPPVKAADDGTHKRQNKKVKPGTKKGTTPPTDATIKPVEPKPDPKDKLAEPQPGGKVDVYANPRPKPRAN